MDRVRIAFHRHAHIVIDAGRTQLELDRDHAAGGFADLEDLEREVVRAQPVWVTGRGALVDTGRQRAHLGDLVGHFLAHQVPAKANLATLTDEELAAIRKHEVIRVEAIARLDALVEPLGRIPAFIGDHPAFAGAGGGSGHGGTTGQRGLGLVGQGAKAHAGDVDRNIKLQRPSGARADHGPGFAFLAIAFDHETGQRSGKKGQVIPMGDLLEQRKAPHPISTEFGLDMDVVHDMGREDGAVADPVHVPGQRGFLCRASVRHFVNPSFRRGGFKCPPCEPVKWFS